MRVERYSDNNTVDKIKIENINVEGAKVLFEALQQYSDSNRKKVHFIALLKKQIEGVL